MLILVGVISLCLLDHTYSVLSWDARSVLSGDPRSVLSGVTRSVHGESAMIDVLPHLSLYLIVCSCLVRFQLNFTYNIKDILQLYIYIRDFIVFEKCLSF